MVPWLFHAVIIAVAREHQYVLHTVVEHRHTAIQIEIMRPTIRIDRSSEDYTSTICECDMITFAAPLLLAIDADRRRSFVNLPLLLLLIVLSVLLGLRKLLDRKFHVAVQRIGKSLHFQLLGLFGRIGVG